jgi:single-strand DNA-binding protein
MLPKINGLFRLTRDAELAYAQSGTAVLKMGLAASEKYKDKESTCFIDATCFGKVAEIIHQYAGQKGNQIYLTGKLELQQWNDKNTGEKKSRHSMIIEGFDFVSNGGNQQQYAPQQPAYQQQPQQQRQQAAPDYGEFDSETPF